MTELQVSLGVRGREGMRRIPGGRFRMGSEDFYPDERPVARGGGRTGFWMDQHPGVVPTPTSAGFVKETDYVSPGGAPADSTRPTTPTPARSCLVPGSLVFLRGRRARSTLDDYAQLVGVRPRLRRWRRPGGPDGSTFHGRGGPTPS